MDTESALDFLRKNQPMPPTNTVQQSELDSYDEIRKYFCHNYDDRCVDLFIGSFGDGDGHGVYQLVENTLAYYAPDIVVPALLRGLQSELESVRYWSAVIAAGYQDQRLLQPLLKIAGTGTFDERSAAAIALLQFKDESVQSALAEQLSDETGSEILKEILPEDD
ncbi:MAG: HEAT repeat domain-containing protein [Phycisphaeraceae bacterium]|nr:HEAT repeat domain-containing protein [Phycisphaerales bacterium]MCB9860496.1 HEAT repeat domain-containing protein [Phycisphaeraceae bacterium]